MKMISPFLFSVLLIACNDSGSVVKDSIPADTPVVHNHAPYEPPPEKASHVPAKLSVLVLPPYDEIANAGISPDVQQYLEQQIAADTNLSLVKFSFKEFMNVAYTNVYDKKYCQPIVDKRKTDVIIMSKLDQIISTGKMDKDKWSLSLRIYNTNTGTQTDSKIELSKVESENMQTILAGKQEQLRREINISQE
jgi:hypothetical protein